MSFTEAVDYNIIFFLLKLIFVILFAFLGIIHFMSFVQVWRIEKTVKSIFGAFLTISSLVNSCIYIVIALLLFSINI